MFRGLKLAAERAYGDGVDGITVAIQGVGHVGAFLAEKLHAAGARLVIADVNQDALREVAEKTGARIVSTDSHLRHRCGDLRPLRPWRRHHARGFEAPEGQGDRWRGQ